MSQNLLTNKCSYGIIINTNRCSYLGKKRYDNSSSFYREYFGECIERLTYAIMEYKWIKTHNRDEFFLANMLK